MYASMRIKLFQTLNVAILLQLQLQLQLIQVLLFDRNGVFAVPLANSLSDPSKQPIFVEYVPNALDLGYRAVPDDGCNDTFHMSVGYSADHYTGLVYRGERVATEIFGYGQDGVYLWPGVTFEVTNYGAGGPESIKVIWSNELRRNHILPVDTSIHWAFSVDGYDNYTIEEFGVPMIPHLHGGATDYEFDGNPEGFWTPDAEIIGPFWNTTPDGFTDEFVYDNTSPAANLWYHDHTLGLTRLNVYAGMAGFYFIRDDIDTGDDMNPLGLPSGSFELAYAIQDRIFTQTGALFYPAFPGDPAYEGFIVDEGAELPDDIFPGGGPTALAEFFGDHMVVNGKIWPKADVKPRQYRIHLLNGCDSRYLVVQFMIVPKGSKDPSEGTPLEFIVIGSDNGLGTPRTFLQPLVIEPAGRYDIIIDFEQAAGQRVILHNLGGDAPFGGAFGDDLSSEDFFEDRQTDKIMAWDVQDGYQRKPKFDPFVIRDWRGIRPRRERSKLSRELALFEGKDEFGRLQPLLGSATEDPRDPRGLFAAYTWADPTTEKPRYMTTEEWYLINFTADAHSMHLHLTHFEVIAEFTFTYVVDGEQEVVNFMGGVGTAPKISSISDFEYVDISDNFYYGAGKDTFTVLPGNPDTFEGRGSVIRMKFPKIGEYSWHCHILSHEDHEMMRRFEVVPNENYPVQSQNW